MATTAKAPVDANKAGRSTAGIPTAALRRFANDLESEVPASKFLQVNRDRVSDFINRKEEQDKSDLAKARAQRTIKVPGICDYDSINKPSTMPLIQLQSLPEFQPSLGARSRFGEGDGSFFDQWLNADTAKSKHMYDKDGFPVMKFNGLTQGGFKRHLGDYKSGKDIAVRPSAYIQTYAERKAARIKKEQEDKQEIKQEEQNGNKEKEKQPEQAKDNTPFVLPPLSRLNSATSALTEISVNTDDFIRIDVPIRKSDLKLPSLETLSASDKESYFGDNARIAFFESYRQLARMRNTIGLQGGEDEELEALLTARTQNMEQFEDMEELADLIDCAVGMEMEQHDGGDGDNDDFEPVELGELVLTSSNNSFSTQSRRGMILEDGDDSSQQRDVGTLSRHQSRRILTLEDGTDSPQQRGVGTLSRHQSRRAMMSVDGNDSPTRPYPLSRQNTAKSSTGYPLYVEEDSKPSTARSVRSARSNNTNSPYRKRPQLPSRTNTRTFKSRTLYSRQRMDDSQDATEEEKQRLFEHLQQQDHEATPSGRPLSARSRFLVGCVRKGILPQASLIIRKGVTTTLSIASFGIGNELALLLAASVPTLPMLEALNISDNNLTDAGLVPIVKSLTSCQHLKSLDVSRNKVDSATAKALLQYISTPACNLTHLIMANANVDDNEAAEFVKVIANRHNFKELDLSENQLGSHEFALKRKETAGMALGSLLSDPRCTMEILKLSWNMLRFQSGIDLVRSLKVNTSLTYLDLSFNRLCAEGGDALGNALHSNRTLQVLKLAHNNITSRPCCTILSGIVSCESLKEVDLSKNPIGELGARLLLAIDLKHGDRVKVDIRNCQLRNRDTSCWFDPTKPKKEYTLHLNEPYERCICIELLRLVSNPNADMVIDSYQYKGPDDTDFKDLELEIYCESHDSQNPDGHISPREAERKIEETRNMYKETANRIFRQYDTDNSGGLDRIELGIILDQIGLDGSAMMVNQLMSIYDTDGSGLVEEDEFVAFVMDVKASSMETVDIKPADRYLYLKEDGASAPTTKPALYFPPEVGTVHVKFSPNTDKEISPMHISQRSVQTMLDATKSSEDRSAIFDYALSVMRLQFSDAQTFYRVMLKEIGSAQNVLIRLIPRMSTPNDARLLITFGTNNDFELMHSLRQALGPLYFIYIGLPNGFYRLNLGEVCDDTCLKALIELSNSSAAHRKRVGLGDTSQDGNWTCFRNTVYDGKSFTITDEFLNNLPQKGRLEFDFININFVNMSEMEISNFRLFRLMQSLGMVKEDKRRRIFDKLNFDKEEGRAISRGTGYRPHSEMRTSHMEQASNYLHKLYSSYASHRPPLVEQPISEIERQFLHPSTGATASPSPVHGTHVGTPAPGTATHSPSTSQKEKDATTPKSKAAAVENKETKSGTDSAVMGGGVHNDSHGSFVMDMIESGVVDPTIIAERLLETLKFALAGRFVTCVQLALLVEKFPDGFLPWGEFSTYRTELIIALYTRVVDIINFDYVLKELESAEVAILLFRLGWLNIWNPIKAEGRIVLDLSRREEKQMLRMLLVLNFAEPGQSWADPSFRHSRTDAAEEGWVIPVSWYAEPSLPNSGILSLKYFSGLGCNQDDCAPNPACRHTLMALVLAKSYSADVWSNSKANLEAVNLMVEKMGFKIYFTTEAQKEHSSHHNHPPAK